MVLAYGKRYSCGILGATGTVGQRFVILLQDHPFLEVTHLGASPSSRGKRYVDATKWKMSTPMPAQLEDMQLRESSPEEFKGCEIVFSASSDDVAGDIESAFLAAHFKIFSNAKNYRRQEQTPLIVPLVNIDHTRMISAQRKRFSSDGFLIANANCSTTGLVVPLKALQDRFGAISCVSVVTMQAISGAGYPGVSSMDIFDNVVPFIPGEEEKIEFETRKILGEATTEGFSYLPSLRISAQCNRVPVLDGHLECVSVSFQRRPPPAIEDIKKAFREYVCEVQSLGCPSAPKQAIHVLDGADRPQPRLDREVEGGYACSIGRIRPDEVFDIKFVVLSHNTVIGAAGSGVLLAEYTVMSNLI